jgi:glycosyltransferase involved in cell wall biosynthesis
METQGIHHPHIALEGSPIHARRAAVVVFSYYPSDVRVMRGAQAMRRAGFEVDLLCLQKTASEPRREQVDGVEVFRIGLNKRRAGKLTYAIQYIVFVFISFLWLSCRRLTRRYDVVHVHNMPDFLVFCAAFAKLLGSRVVLDLHDPTPEVFITVYELAPDHWLVKLLRCTEKFSIWFADLVLTPNIAFRDLFVARSCSSEKIEIVMNSPLEEVFPLTEPQVEFESGAKEDPEFVVMYHGTPVERHGLHVAVDAISQLAIQIPEIRFHIYGEETDYMREKVIPLIARLGLNDKVQQFGHQPQQVIARAVSECSVGVIPNLRSVFTEINLPTRIFEYLAFGKPVIVPETRGIRDYFGVQNMLFFSAGEAKSLASQIRWIFEHPDQARTIVQKGQEIYRSHLWKFEERRFISRISALAP